MNREKEREKQKLCRRYCRELRRALACVPELRERTLAQLAESIEEYLDEHHTEKITLDDLAEKFFINKFYLSKIFKETYGTTVNNYLISKRITRAKQLLRFTDMTVDEVGAAVGMGDANYFSRMFRKVEGISPREYRKQW